MSDNSIGPQNRQLGGAANLQKALKAVGDSKDDTIVKFKSAEYSVGWKSVLHWFQSNDTAYNVKKNLHADMTDAFVNLGSSRDVAEEMSIKILKGHYTDVKGNSPNDFLNKKEKIKAKDFKEIIKDYNFQKKVLEDVKSNSNNNNNNNSYNDILRGRGPRISEDSKISEDVHDQLKSDIAAKPGGGIINKDDPKNGPRTKEEVLKNKDQILEGRQAPKKGLPDLPAKGLSEQKSDFYQKKMNEEFNKIKEKGFQIKDLEILHKEISSVHEKSVSMDAVIQKFGDIPVVKSKVNDENYNNNNKLNPRNVQLSQPEMHFENEYMDDNNENNNLTPGNVKLGQLGQDFDNEYMDDNNNNNNNNNVTSGNRQDGGNDDDRIEGSIKL